MSKDHILKLKLKVRIEDHHMGPPDFLYQGTVSYGSSNNSAFTKKTTKGTFVTEPSLQTKKKHQNLYDKGKIQKARASVA